MNGISSQDITVDYLGLELRSPLIPSASPLAEKVEALREMENCGAGAVVFPTLFENPWMVKERSVESYLKKIAQAKTAIHIPVIASLNADSPEGWTLLARQMEEAGADAIELNVYHPGLSPALSSAQIEQTYIDVVKVAASAVSLPFAVKLPPFFTNLTRLTRDLNAAGASGLVLFNRFYQPDLDLLSMGPGYTLRLSTSSENRLPLRWIALLYQCEMGYLSASTGIRTGGDVLKMILSGASTTHVCSILLQRGIPWIQKMEVELRQWMDTCQILSLREARGSLSHRWMENPAQMEREEYRRALQGYTRIDVPSWHDEVPLHAEPHPKI
jgi:dihydroorotate dehydrogenase (fumarate)